MPKPHHSFAVIFVTLYGATIIVGLQPRSPEVFIASPQSAGTERTELEGSPQSVLIDVPFTSQAPFADWDAPYQEACEEASLIMVHAYLQGLTLTTEDADAQIQTLVQWEQEQGYAEDLRIEDVAAIAKEYYGYSAEVHYKPTIDLLQSLLAMGSPIIVPAAGRALGNPYFSGEGPWYHMLVLTGYDERSFTANDPGTRRGGKYKYKQETLLNSIHNWTGVKEEIYSGIPVVLVLKNV
jgi:uncharacterized protein YvpB